MARNLSPSRRREIKRRKSEDHHGRYGAISPLDHYAVEEFNRQEQQREAEWLQERIGAVQSVVSETPVIAIMLAIQGYINWYLISGHPVLLNRHTQMGRSQTAIVMDLMAA